MTSLGEPPFGVPESSGMPSPVGLMEFAAPGLLHWLGNALFAIQGHAQMFGLDPASGPRSIQEILKGYHQANGALEVFRCLTLEGGLLPPMQAGILLPRVCEAMKLTLRQHGLRLDYRHSSRETPRFVDGCLLTRALLVTMRALVAEVPSGYEGRVSLDLLMQQQGVELQLELKPLRAQLPFLVPIEAVLKRARQELPVGRVRVDGDHERQTLRLSLPCTENRV